VDIVPLWKIENYMMNKSNATSCNEDDWTVVAEQNTPTPTRRSATPFCVIDEIHLERGSEGTDEIISNIIEENRELTEKCHRLKIENEWVAREIKGARFLISKMLQTLCLHHDQQDYRVVKSSSIIEDLTCFGGLLKKLLYAVESGNIRKVERTEVKSMAKEEPDIDLKSLHEANSAPEAAEESQTLFKCTEDQTNLKNAYGKVMRALLPRIEDLIEMQQDVRPRKTRRTNKVIGMKQRNILLPAVMHQRHGISKKKRWCLNRGAPRQAFTARRKC